MGKTLELNTQWGSTEKVELEINQYRNNGCLSIGLIAVGEEYSEPYGDMTVNLNGRVPDYCGYVDMSNMPELAEFIEKNDIGEVTGLTARSGFNEYPLYLFHVDKLRELCPEGMAAYEHNIGKDKKPEEKEMAR